MSIASRIVRSKADPLGGWENQIKAKITLDAAAATTAAESATAEKKLLHTSLLERVKIHGAALEKSIEAWQANPEAGQAMHRETLANLNRSEQELLAFHGIASKDIARLDQLVFRTVDEIAKEAKEQGVPFSQKGLWSETWIEFLQKQFPNLDPSAAEALWKGRIAMMKYAETVIPTGGTTSKEGVSGITGLDPTEIKSAYGFDYVPEKIELGGPAFIDDFLNWLKKGGVEQDVMDFEAHKKWSETTAERKGLARTSGYGTKFQQYVDWAEGRARNRPVITPTDQRTEMGMLSGVGGMINLGKDLLASELELEDVALPTTGTFLGADNTAQLQALDQEATSPLTDAAEAFLIKFENYSAQYGSERAMQLLSREWLDLKLRDKRSIQKHYENQ